jgi:ribosomal-protein-alanine N-acetyltransferase
VASVLIEAPSLRRQAEFLAAVRRSRKLHGRFAAPPSSAEDYRAYLKRFKQDRHFGHFVCTREGDLAGVININEVIRGPAQYGYLGYYAFAPHAGQGMMCEGLLAVLRLAFGKYDLHRVEANIQPENARSIRLVKALGFRLEGYSPRYLKLAGRWRDHERWAMTIEDFDYRPRSKRR